MMTLHVLHAGDGYSYLTDQVASHDREREAGQDLTDYYTAHGTPPGQWWGAGLEALADPRALIGHDHPALAVGGMVDEAQMSALFGEGLHPNADALIEHLIDQGMSAEDAVKAARLGRKFPAYANDIPLLARTDAAVKRHTAEHGRRPSVAERRLIEREIADQLFTDQHGRPPRTDRELASWIVNEKAKVRQPVAGFDLVFTPAKSVSVLWGLGGEEARRAVTDAHHAAVTDALSWLQDEALYTRTGAAGERQIDTRGMTVALFDHFDNRAGDPNLHTHATVSVKVQGDDGVWRSIDSKALHRHAVAASQRYNARIMAELRARLGITVTERSMGEGKQPVLEVAGIDERLRELFSSRRSEIEARHEQLVLEYRNRHSKMPSDKASYALFQQATLDTREGKAPARSLAEMDQHWRAKAIEL
ncbi:MAG: relaxase domain-containing protein, partial [Gordonia polyisoprenivorans]|nr:relaxase domain-containing protein [Gordonia polyisoprenivorans]